MQFSFATVPNLVCAPGAVTRAVDFAQGRRIKRILLVTDPGVIAAGLAQPLLAALAEGGLEASVFSGVEPDPGEHVVSAAYRQARDSGAQMVIGMGGGSAMDVAKLAAYFADSAETLRQIIGVDMARGRRLPLVLIPTTAGTGSEVTPIAIVTLSDHTKGGVVSQLLLPDMALLDPHLTLTLPPAITAHTGVDAMVHAIEAYTSKHRKNPVSDALAQQSLKLLNDNIRTAFHSGHDIDARGNMLLGACLAGMAFANAPVAAVHALAYPLGGTFRMPHGLSNAVILTEVLRFNRPAAEAQYAELGRLLSGQLLPDDKACDYLIDTMDTLLVDLGIDTRLSTYGIGHGDLDRLSEDALGQQRLLQNNPREVSLADARAIYERRLHAA